MTDTDDKGLEELVHRAGRRPSMPDDVRDRLEVSFRRELTSANRKSVTRRLQAGGAIAACLVAALLILTRPAPTPSHAIATVERRQGESFLLNGSERVPLRPGGSVTTNDRITTSDGSLAIRPIDTELDVRLGENSEIIALEPGTVRLIAGSLYVDAPPGARHQPFSILIGDVTVNHTGTQYLVSTQQDGISIAVREGEVSVTVNSRTIVGRAKDGQAELLQFDADESWQRETVAPYGPRWNWANRNAPTIETDGMQLIDFLGWVERQSGLRFDYATDELRDDIMGPGSRSRIVGNIPTDDVMAALSTAMDLDSLTWRIDDGIVIIRKP